MVSLLFLRVLFVIIFVRIGYAIGGDQAIIFAAIGGAVGMIIVFF